MTSDAEDAEMFRWLVAEWDKNGVIDAGRHHPCGSAGCALFTISSQHVRGYGLRGAIKAAQEAEIK